MQAHARMKLDAVLWWRTKIWANASRMRRFFTTWCGVVCAWHACIVVCMRFCMCVHAREGQGRRALSRHVASTSVNYCQVCCYGYGYPRLRVFFFKSFRRGVFVKFIHQNGQKVKKVATWSTDQASQSSMMHTKHTKHMQWVYLEAQSSFATSKHQM